MPPPNVMTPKVDDAVPAANGPGARVVTSPEPGHDNAERLRAIVETAVDGILTIDSRGTVESINPAAERMFGYISTEVIGRNISALMPEPFRSEHNSYLHRYLSTGERRIIGIGREVLGQRKDGRTFPMELAVSEMHLDGRRMFTGIVRDITERRTAEEKLRRLAALLDDSNDAIKSLDLEGSITSWNPGAERLYGYSKEAALHLNVRDLLPHERRDEVSGAITRLVRGEKIKPFETQRVTADGRIVDILCTMTLLKGRDDEPDTIVVTDRDITERKKSESALRGSESKTRAIVEAAVDAILTIDEDGLVESANRAAEQLFGYDASELIGENVNKLMPSPYHEEHNGYIKRYLRTRVKKIIGIGREVVGRRKDGSLFPMELAISEMNVGEKVMFTGIVRDISERKRIEEELRQQARSLVENNQILNEFNLKAEEANSAKGAFLANMSHEIRTPMTAILGFAEQLQDETLPPDEQRAAITTIRRNGEYLLTILNDILDLSKIEAGRMDVEHIPLSPGDIALDVESLLRVRAEAKHLPVKVEFATPIPAIVTGDPTRLRQILVNLTANAIKFTEEGSVRLVLGFDPERDPPILWFEVIDTGIGISPEQAKRLFEPFSQANDSTTREYGGTGLGLAISRRMAELLNGDIVVQSELGQGSRFRLSIAAKVAPDTEMVKTLPTRLDQRSDKTSAAPTDALVGKRILLAEDGRDNQVLVSGLLRKAGAEVTVVCDGKQAMKSALTAAASQQAFDVIILDMQMPVMDGYEAASALRGRGYDGPIVAMTAHAMAGDRKKCLAAGCNDYMTKPIRRHTLIETVRKHATVATSDKG